MVVTPATPARFVNDAERIVWDALRRQLRSDDVLLHGVRITDAIDGIDPEAPHHFIGPSPRIPASPEMTAWARERTAPGMTVREVVQAIGAAIHAEFTYDPEATTVETPPAEAFARRHGVCQDFAQIMIGCLRGIGVPAGYVSGFLRTEPPRGKPRLEGADAMHAWTRAWCGWETIAWKPISTAC